MLYSAHRCSGGFTSKTLAFHQSSATSSLPSSLGIVTVPASALATFISVSCSYFSCNEESPTWSCQNSDELGQSEHHGEEIAEMHICWGTKELSFVMAGVCARVFGDWGWFMMYISFILRVAERRLSLGLFIFQILNSLYIRMSHPHIV